LLSNTPLREVIEDSPSKDKRIFLVENYPKNIEKLPSTLQEAQHRARDTRSLIKLFTIYKCPKL